jgi:RHS repeat-associated protein
MTDDGACAFAAGGTTTYTYDLQGRITSKAQTVNGFLQTVAYRYNTVGQMDQMTLPSGKKVAATYLNNRITGLTVDGTPIIKSADYEPFGPIGEWTWGNDSTTTPNKHTRYFDLDGRNTKIESGNINGAIEPNLIVYDAASRIVALQRQMNPTTNTIDPTKSTTYAYDNLDRLTTVAPTAGNPASPQSYTYDAIGNRLTNNVAGSTTTYSYGTTSHRLNALTGATTKTFTYDNVGNRITDGIQSWIYGGDNRPSAITVTGSTPTTIQSGINALGQRVIKTVNNASQTTITRFMYDEAGRLIGEYDIAGNPIQETIWLGDLPVSVLNQAAPTTPATPILTSLTAGSSHTCALSQTGTAYCWGANGSGQIGDGTTTHRSIPTPVSSLSGLPTTGLTSLTAAGNRTCALTSTGAAYCWGTNSAGQLGDGTTQSRSLPTPVIGMSSGVVSLAAGNTHTCAKADASVLCWGSNSQGQLGMGSASSIPTLTPTIVPSLTNIASLTAGNNTTCAVTNQGAALCWGSNASGKLGDGTSTNRSLPTPVIGLASGVISIRTHNAHSCAITSQGQSQGQLYCWGFNLFGQLGDASNTNRLAPTLVSGINSLSSISTGESHTCAVANQASWCWGINDQGRLGDGTTTNRNIPTAVSGQGSNMSSQPNAIATGNGHSCSIAQDGSATCWGLNTFGQLGDATTTPRNTPTPVQLTPTVTIPPLQVGYVHSDHLGSPRVITRATDNAAVWRWKNEDAFGNNQPNEDPSNTGTSFKYNLRMSWQYYDKETDTLYNTNRDYDAKEGRYRQSDPIGLTAGFSTYGYVSGNPLGFIDPFGLCQVAVWRGGYIAGWKPCDQPAAPSPPSSPPPSSPTPQCDSCGNPSSPPRQWSPDIPLANMSGVFIPPTGGSARVKTCYYTCAAAVTASGGIKDGLAHSADHWVQHQPKEVVGNVVKTGAKWATRGLTCLTLFYNIPSGVNNCYLTCGMDRLRE